MTDEAILVLEDGRSFLGRSLGYAGETFGEAVFNTAMTGYQEILTDPSYKGQLVTMTYPLIGNYGVTEEDEESEGPHVAGFVVREASGIDSNFRSTGSLHAYLERHRIVGISGVDSRALTRHLRTRGAMRGIISTTCLDEQLLLKKMSDVPQMTGLDLASAVTCKKPYPWTEGFVSPFAQSEEPEPGPKIKIAVIDFGIKRNILRCLVHEGFEPTVYPADTAAEEILGSDARGVFLSNGPGDPEPVTYGIETVSKLLGELPIFGICLGHQILALAFGGRVPKLKFGHRGANHPVKNLETGRVEITSQNHGFCVDAATLDDSEVEITHINLNDDTVEGLRHKQLPAFSVQYHPESSPGPQDSRYLFKKFREQIEN